MEDRERLGIELLFHDVEGSADVLGKRLDIAVERHPDESAVRNLAGQLLERDVLFPQSILITCLRPGNIDASSEAIELPGVKHARHVIGIAGWLGDGKAA